MNELTSYQQDLLKLVRDETASIYSRLMALKRYGLVIRLLIHFPITLML